MAQVKEWLQLAWWKELVERNDWRSDLEERALTLVQSSSEGKSFEAADSPLCESAGIILCYFGVARVLIRFQLHAWAAKKKKRGEQEWRVTVIKNRP